MSKVRIPKQLFVVHTGGGKTPLGFLHEYNPNTATGRKKMSTQLEWAFRHNGGSIIVEEDNGVWIKRGYRWEYPVKNQPGVKVDFLEKIAPDLIPQVWDNVPMAGFKIEESVPRYSTSNKLWRVLDPRGFIFEVSTDNFEKIVLNGTIVQGFIQEECIWLGNKNLALAK